MGRGAGTVPTRLTVTGSAATITPRRRSGLSTAPVPVKARTPIILALCLAVLATGSLGLNSGMVLHADGHGHLALTAPRVAHAHAHAHGDADHGPQDFGPDADHGGLHDLIAACSDSPMGVQKAERSSSSDLAAGHDLPAGADACVASAFGCGGLSPLLPGAGVGAPTRRGGTAHVAHTCLRSVVLLV